MRNLFLAGLSAVAIAAAAGLAACATGGDGASAAASSSRPVVVATRRLTESQYRQTIIDLYGSDIAINGRFEPEARNHGLLAGGPTIAEAFNLLNHVGPGVAQGVNGFAASGNPNTVFTNSLFGRITTAADPRILQFALKYVF